MNFSAIFFISSILGFSVQATNIANLRGHNQLSEVSAKIQDHLDAKNNLDEKDADAHHRHLDLIEDATEVGNLLMEEFSDIMFNCRHYQYGETWDLKVDMTCDIISGALCVYSFCNDEVGTYVAKIDKRGLRASEIDVKVLGQSFFLSTPHDSVSKFGGSTCTAKINEQLCSGCDPNACGDLEVRLDCRNVLAFVPAGTCVGVQ